MHEYLVRNMEFRASTTTVDKSRDIGNGRSSCLKNQGHDG